MGAESGELGGIVMNKPLNIKILVVFFISLICFQNSYLWAGSNYHNAPIHWQIIYTSPNSSINLWDFQTQERTQIYKDENVDHIIQPSRFSNNKKILFAKNYIDSGLGEIIFYDLEAKKEEIIYKNRFGIREIALSPSEKTIAFLSNYDYESKTCSLYLLDINSKIVEEILHKTVKSIVRYHSIDWFPDGKRIIFSGTNNRMNVLDLTTQETQTLGKGYNPKISQDGNKVLYIRKSLFNKAIPAVYNLNTKKAFKISIPKVCSTIWSPNRDQVIIVKNDSDPSKHNDFSEWHREVILYDLQSRESKSIFSYKGFNDISVTEDLSSGDTIPNSPK